MRSHWLLASVCVGLAGVTAGACVGGSNVTLGQQPMPGQDGGVPVGDSAAPPVGDVAAPPPPGDSGGGAETGIVGTGPCAATPQPATAPNGYYVVGPTICNSSGQPHLFLGVDRPSLEWDSSGQALSGAAGIPASDFTNMVA